MGFQSSIVMFASGGALGVAAGYALAKSMSPATMASPPVQLPAPPCPKCAIGTLAANGDAGPLPQPLSLVLNIVQETAHETTFTLPLLTPTASLTAGASDDGHSDTAGSAAKRSSLEASPAAADAYADSNASAVSAAGPTPAEAAADAATAAVADREESIGSVLSASGDLNGSRGRRESSSTDSTVSGTPERERHKLVLVVVAEAKLGVKRTATEAARAALGAFKKLWAKRSVPLAYWQEDGSDMSTMFAHDEPTVIKLQSAVRAAGLATHTVCAPGSGARKRLVMAVGPGPISTIEALTADLT